MFGYYANIGAIILFFFRLILASALEPGIDLLEALDMHSNYSQYAGVTLTQGSKNNMGFHLSKFY